MEILKNVKIWIITSICLLAMFIGLAVMSAGNYIELQKVKTQLEESPESSAQISEVIEENEESRKPETSEQVKTDETIKETSIAEEESVEEEGEPNQNLMKPGLDDVSGSEGYSKSNIYVRTALDWIDAYSVTGTTKKRMDALRPYMTEELLNSMFKRELDLLEKYGSSSSDTDSDSENETTNKIDIQYYGSKATENKAQVLIIYHNTRKWVKSGDVEDIFKLLVFDEKYDSKTEKWVIEDIQVANNVRVNPLVRGGN